MCGLKHLCDIDKEDCVGYVYSVEGVNSGTSAHDFLLQVIRSKIILPELFLAVNAYDGSAEYLFTPGKSDAVYPNGDINRDYRTFTLCGRYNYGPVCLSFHMFREIRDYPLNVLVVLVPRRSEEVARKLAFGLSGIA